MGGGGWVEIIRIKAVLSSTGLDWTELELSLAIEVLRVVSSRRCLSWMSLMKAAVNTHILPAFVF